MKPPTHQATHRRSQREGGANAEPYPAEVLRALRPLAALLAPVLAPMVARELRAMASTGDLDTADPWVDQRSSPLGFRAHCRACSAGKIEGARKIGKRWLARRSALDAYIETHGRAPRVEHSAEPDGEPTEAEIAAELRAAGLYYTGGRSRGREPHDR